ncbi:MAG: thioredoxin-dependent thiol peroxidase [Bacteroidota bacterium]|nr:thioredoxin-dependent thiol peroxidase [Bacteroidota bacterium]
MEEKTVAELKIGQKAPAFKLPSTDGRIISLNDFAGKKIDLYFYPKDMTPGCTTEACSFRDNYSELQKRGAVILGISADSIQSHQKFSDKYELPFLLLSDENKEVSKAYGVWKQKSFLGKKYLGIERSTFIINEEGKIKTIFRKVKVAGHTEEILQNI